MIAQNVKDLFPNDLQQITYIGEFPTDADVCISLIESGGPHGTYFAKDEMNTPYLKVMVRDPSYPTGYATVSAVKDLITGFADARLLGIVLRGDIDYLGRDDKRRNIWQLNYRIFEYRKNINTTSIGTSVYVSGEFVLEWNADTKLDKVTTAVSDDRIRVYAVRPDGTQTMWDTGVNAKDYWIPLRDSNGDLLVPLIPTSNNGAASRYYADNTFVKSQTQYSEKPNYGVYTFLLDGDTIKDSLNAFANYPQAYAIAQYDSSAKLHSDTPIDSDGDDTVVNKEYAANNLVKKLPAQEGVYRVYANKPTGDDYYAVSNGAVPGTLAERNRDGDVIIPSIPSSTQAATAKEYVDGLIDKAWVCCIKSPTCAYSVYNFTLPQKLYSDTRCYIPDDVSENTVVSNMQLTFAKGEPPTVIVCKVAYFDKTDNTLHKVSYDLEKLDSAEAVENYTGNNCAYYIY